MNDTPPSASTGLTARVKAILAIIVVASVALLAGRHYLGWLAGGEPPVPAVAVGGPFALIDQDGRPKTDADFRGRLMLVYFGFTYCPDVCPTALTAVGQALDGLGADADKIAPIFITVDPDRDTPEQIKEYVRHFHPRLTGLTGTKEQIASAAKAYRVYYAKVRQQGAPEDEYTMDHTSITYLMGPDGKFLAHFSHGTEPEAMAARIRRSLKQ